MSYLFSFSRYQTKCVIKFLFRRLMTSYINFKIYFGFFFGQLITEIFFLKISSTKCGRKASPRPFYKKIKIEHISGSLV